MVRMVSTRTIALATIAVLVLAVAGPKLAGIPVIVSHIDSVG
jgi:hypothetical protein